jgi:hypothetical protein
MSDTVDTNGAVPPTEPPVEGPPPEAAPPESTFTRVELPQEERPVEDVPNDQALYQTLRLWAWVAYAISAALALIVWGILSFFFDQPHALLGFWSMAPTLLHFSLSIKRSHAEEITWFYSYDVALVRARAGLRFVPFGLMNLEAEPRDIQKINVPAHEDKIFWQDEKVPLPPGLTRPIFMSTTAIIRDPKGNPKSQAQQSVGVGWFILWGINNVPNFRSNSHSRREVDGQLRMVSHAVIGEDIAANDLDTLLANLAQINLHLDDHLRTRTKNWGIEIYEVGLFKINPSHEFATAQRDAAMAPFLAQAKVTAAKATARERILLGDADGRAEQARIRGPLIGRAEGLKRILTDLGVEGAEVLASDTARGIAENTELMMVGAGDGLRDILGAVRVGQASLRPRGNRGPHGQRRQGSQGSPPQSTQP